MTTAPGRVVLTYADYLELPNDRNRYEILEGELAVSPAPGTLHQRVLLRLSRRLADFAERNRLGEVLVAPCDVLLSDTTVVQPDLLYVSRARRQIVEAAFVRGAPDLVVEIISPTSARTDREVKKQLYARYSVPHYWIFDPAGRVAEGNILENGAYRAAASASGGEEFAAPPFSKLRIPLSLLWGE